MPTSRVCVLALAPVVQDEVGDRHGGDPESAR